MTLTPNNLCSGTAIKSNRVATNDATAKAVNHLPICRGAWLANKMTVVMEEGPASNEMAIGTIKGSPCVCSAIFDPSETTF